MFSELKDSDRKGWNTAVALSLAMHVFVLLLLAHRSAPRYVTPSEVALGTPYSSGTVIYIAPLGPERSRDTDSAHLAKLEPAVRPAAARKRIDRQREQASRTRDTAPEITAHGGSPYGVHVPGTPLTGPAIIPALPQVFPDPPITNAELPPGLQGDVIVEVTIDEKGNVTELKLTQGIGHGIDEKVLAVLRGWRFRPAMRDGVTIASQHLVHFHYPS